MIRHRIVIIITNGQKTLENTTRVVKIGSRSSFQLIMNVVNIGGQNCNELV